MSKRSKEKFHLSFKVLFRLAIFSLLVYLLISYVSSRQLQPNVLGTDTLSSPSNPVIQKYLDQAYAQLPHQSQKTLQNLPSSPAIIFLQQKIDYLKTETADFPQKQITDIKKAVIQTVYQNIMKDLEKK